MWLTSSPICVLANNGRVSAALMLGAPAFWWDAPVDFFDAFMTLFRLSLCAAVLSFAHCSHSGSPVIAEAESEAPAVTGSPEKVDLTLALTPTFGAVPAPEPAQAPPPPSEPVKVKRTRVAQPKAAISRPAKPSAEVVKASGPPIPPMPKTKEPPAIDRSNLLNLMREPTER